MKLIWAYCFILIPLLANAISFSDYTKHAYDVSEQMIESNGRVTAADFEKASALADDPLRIETFGRNINGNNSIDSGLAYGVMLDYTFKIPSFRSAKANEFGLQKKELQQEIFTYQGLIQVSSKRDWLLYQLEQERSVILTQKRDFSYKAYQIGEKKFKAGRLSKMEFLRLESEYSNTLQELSLAIMEVEHAQHHLKETVLSDKEIVIDDLNFDFINSVSLDDRLKNAPLFKSLNIRINILNAQITTLQHSTIETASFGVGATQEPTQKSIDFRLTIPLSVSSKHENKIAALMSERSALIHIREVAKQKLEFSVRGIFEHLKDREENMQVLIKNEQKYETLFTMAHKGYEGGVIGQFEYLAAKNAYYDSRLRTLLVKQSYIEDMFIIEKQIGGIW